MDWRVSLDQVQVANNQQTYIRVANCQTVRMKEEKEVLEHFAGVFTMMNPLTFKEIFQTTVPYMVERISKNYALQVGAVSLTDVWAVLCFICSEHHVLFSVVFQIVANSFLANLSTSALFATILVEYLLERLPEMGSNVELSNLYLKLFKLVFGSVSLFAAENEQMLKVSVCFLPLFLPFFCHSTFTTVPVPSATPPQDSQQLHGAGPIREGTLQLLPASPGTVPLYWRR